MVEFGCEEHEAVSEIHLLYFKLCSPVVEAVSSVVLAAVVLVVVAEAGAVAAEAVVVVVVVLEEAEVEAGVVGLWVR